MRCEPANTLIEKLGGLTKVSRIIGKSPHAVMKWRMPREKGGTGGAVPHWHHEALHVAAEELNMQLQPSDLVPSYSRSSVEPGFVEAQHAADTGLRHVNQTRSGLLAVATR